LKAISKSSAGQQFGQPECAVGMGSGEQHAFWLWPNLLSLDAPLVAIVWQLLFAHCFGGRLTSATVAVLGLCVWPIYAADRLLDGLRNSPPPRTETARHRFHRVNAKPIVLVMVPVSAVALWLLVTQLASVLIRSYAILALAVCTYFSIVHSDFPIMRSRLPKELAVAVLFASGVCIPVWLQLSIPSRILLPFSAFCLILWINAAGIEHWEAELRPGVPFGSKPEITRRCSVRMHTAAIAVAVASALLAWGPARPASERIFYEAIAISSLSLAILDLIRRRLSGDELRVLADVALLSPLLFFPFLLK
jgi:hypothetical protein